MRPRRFSIELNPVQLRSERQTLRQDLIRLSQITTGNFILFLENSIQHDTLSIRDSNSKLLFLGYLVPLSKWATILGAAWPLAKFAEA